jgi:ABC-2 type transport system permease protein
MPDANGPTAGLTQLAMPWSSPVEVDPAASKGRRIVPLMESSPQSWTSDSLKVAPQGMAGPQFEPPAKADRGRKLLAVAVEGRFSSYFQSKPSPLLAETPSPTAAGKPGEPPAPAPSPVFAGQIDHSPASSRIILVASNSFLANDAMALASVAARTQVLGPIQFVENAIDWSLEDRALLAIRGRANFARLLIPLSRNEQLFWEYLNYLLALLGLVAVWSIHRLMRSSARRRTRLLLAAGRA